MNSRIKYLFERYQSGSARAEERRLVEEWFSKYDAEQNDHLIDDSAFTIADKHISELIHRRYGYGLSRAIYWLSAAAVLLIALTLFLFKGLYNQKQPAAMDYLTLTAPRGLRKTFKLSDSTTIFLNAGSVVRIPFNYNLTMREIWLTGEAYFDVTHNAAKPFRVHTGKLQISDIGTTFNVKSYAEDKETTVSVESGIVKVEKNAELLAPSLTANTQLLYDNQTGGHQIGFVSVKNSLAWHRNILRFDNASFNEIARVAGRWYNANIKLSDTADVYRHYTISFQNESLSQVLKVLADLTGASYRIDQQTITLNLKNCKKV